MESEEEYPNAKTKLRVVMSYDVSQAEPGQDILVDCGEHIWSFVRTTRSTAATDLVYGVSVTSTSNYSSGVPSGTAMDRMIRLNEPITFGTRSGRTGRVRSVTVDGVIVLD